MDAVEAGKGLPVAVSNASVRQATWPYGPVKHSQPEQHRTSSQTLPQHMSLRARAEPNGLCSASPRSIDVTKPKTLRIAVDMDGVLADMHAALAREADQLFVPAEQDAVGSLEEELERERPPSSTSRIIGPYLTSGQTEALWRRIAGIENFWEGLQELEPGAVARLASLAAQHQWELLFLTQRPPTAGASVQRQTQRWLQRHGFELPSVCTTHRSRGSIAAALDFDIVVDDRFEGCAAVAAESDARAVLVWREAEVAVPAKARRLGITVVHSVGECLDFLERASSRTRAGRNVFTRFRDALRRPGDARSE